MLLCAKALLDEAEGRSLTRAEIRESLHGNLCRCTGYTDIVDAIQVAQAQASA
jgi:aerobic carbon-monoxide dehydrogenase small subunit